MAIKPGPFVHSLIAICVSWDPESQEGNIDTGEALPSCDISALAKDTLRSDIDTDYLPLASIYSRRSGTVLILHKEPERHGPLRHRKANKG
jgi:hypothetical protein